MEYHVCTFEIQLQQVRSETRGWGRTGVQAVWKSERQQIIATGNTEPTFRNGTAWFNELFEIKTDLKYDPSSQRYQHAPIVLEIRNAEKALASLTLNLAEAAEKKSLPDRDYAMQGADKLKVNISLSCTGVQTVKNRPLRRNKSSKKQIQKASFIKMQEVVVETQPPTNLFSLFRPEDPPLPNGNKPQNNPTEKVPKQPHPQHYYSKSKEIDELKGELATVKHELQSTIAQLTETENACTSLSVTLTHKETEIVNLHAELDALKEKGWETAHRINNLELVEKTKDYLEAQVSQLRREIDNFKVALKRSTTSQNQLKIALQNEKKDSHIKNMALQLLRSQLAESNKSKSDLQTQISKLQQEKKTIKEDVSKWRADWSVEQQQLQEQLAKSEGQFSKLMQRYSELKDTLKIHELPSNLTEIQTKTEYYETKIAQFEEKESVLKQQLVIIEQEMLNLHELLEEKQENEVLLLDHIRKLQYELEGMHSQRQWWEKALGKEIEVMSSWADETDNEGLQKALQRNVHLMQLLQQNSYVILEAERIKRELIRLQKENDELQRKHGLLQQETKQLKERIGVLLKQNKKLLDKNYRITKENETMNKRHTWQSDELEHVKEKLKESKDDYNLIAYQLECKERDNKLLKKQTESLKNIQERFSSSVFEPGLEQGLRVIRQTSSEFLQSTHQISRQCSQLDKREEEPRRQTADIIKQLTHTIQDRIIESESVHAQLQRAIATSLQPIPSEPFQQSLAKLSLTSTKIKTSLLKSGLSPLLSEWQSALSTLLNESQRLLSVR